MTQGRVAIGVRDGICRGLTTGCSGRRSAPPLNRDVSPDVAQGR